MRRGRPCILLISVAYRSKFAFFLRGTHHHVNLEQREVMTMQRRKSGRRVDFEQQLHVETSIRTRGTRAQGILTENTCVHREHICTENAHMYRKQTHACTENAYTYRVCTDAERADVCIENIYT